MPVAWTAVLHGPWRTLWSRDSWRKHGWRSRAAEAAVTGTIPGRSAHPDSYRDCIVAMAEAILEAASVDELADMKPSEELVARYPEWLDDSGCAENSHQQRLCRALADLRALLKQIVHCEDLLP